MWLSEKSAFVAAHLDFLFKGENCRYVRELKRNWFCLQRRGNR